MIFTTEKNLCVIKQLHRKCNAEQNLPEWTRASGFAARKTAQNKHGSSESCESSDPGRLQSSRVGWYISTDISKYPKYQDFFDIFDSWFYMIIYLLWLSFFLFLCQFYWFCSIFWTLDLLAQANPMTWESSQGHRDQELHC